jgi:hypothetical protein
MSPPLSSLHLGVDLWHLTDDEIVSVDEHGPFHLAGTDGTPLKDRYMTVVLRCIVSFQSRARFSEVRKLTNQLQPCSTRAT